MPIADFSELILCMRTPSFIECRINKEMLWMNLFDFRLFQALSRENDFNSLPQLLKLLSFEVLTLIRLASFYIYC